MNHKILKFIYPLVISLFFSNSIFAIGPIQISSNKHGFVDSSNGQPFMYLADQNWQLFVKFNLNEVRQYMADRSAKGFNVIQAEAALWGTCDTPNVEGQYPFLNGNAATPNPAFFRFVSDVIDIAQQYNMVISLFPAEGYCVTSTGVVNANNAFAYGQYLGNRFGNRSNLIFTLGGDQNPQGKEAVFGQLAQGLRQGETSVGGIRHLISYHPGWPESSSQFPGLQSFLDFNMLQAGPSLSILYSMVNNDYKNTSKPTIMSEGAYEANNYQYGDYLTPDALNIRRQAYHSYLAGGFHTYGHRDIMVKDLGGSWVNALNAPGAIGASIAKSSLLQRNFSNYVPDQSVILSGAGSGATINPAMLANDGSGIILYIASQSTVSVNLARISQGNSVKVTFINPQTGVQSVVGTYAKNAQSFSIPGGSVDALYFFDAVGAAPSSLSKPTNLKIL